MTSEGQREALEVVTEYREALKAAMELKSLLKDHRDLQSLKEDEEEMTARVVEIHATNKRYNELDTLCNEAWRQLNRLASANQTVQELSVPLEYGDHKKMQLFKRAFGLEFKITEERAIAFSFYHLSKQHPEQRGIITMDIEADKWKVLRVEPSVEGVSVLLDQLNSGGDLKTFCKQVRQKFKDHFMIRGHTEQ